MKRRVSGFLLVASVAVLAGAAGVAGAAGAQSSPAAGSDYKPQHFQPGKDVVWLPSSQGVVNRMLDLVKLTPADYLIDLGSGDGITVITAAKRGAKALGIEYNPDMVALSRRNAEREGVANRATFVQGDIFKSDFSSATVISLFLLPELNLRLRPTLLAMKPGTRVVSNSFDMGDWMPDATSLRPSDCESYCNVYAWTVPAPVQGAWSLGERELVLQQAFQTFDGSVRSGNVMRPVRDGRLDGAHITFSLGSDRYEGEVRGDVMSGTVNGGGSWQATRRK